MNSGSKSPKLLFPLRMMSQKKRSSKHKTEEPQPVQEEAKVLNRAIRISEFKNEYKKLCCNDFVILKKEYKDLINESMTMKESEYNIWTSIESMSNINLHGRIHIVQVDNLRVTMSSSLFSNAKLDAVFIPDQVKHQVIQYIVSQDPSEDSIFDFFQMIWELNISYLITLTKISKRKGFIYEYWDSKSENKTYSKDKVSYKIKKTKETNSGNLTERLFILENNNLERREITQLHLMTSTCQNDSVLNYYEKLFIKLHEIKSLGLCYPLLFHSSNSNLDQCAMLICIDKIISTLAFGSDMVNIYRMMLELNQYRNLMLQQECHYLYIYEYIDWFLRKSFKIMKSKKRTKTRSMIE